jgi:hypothetical protein
MTALTRVRPIPPSILNFCQELFGVVGAADLTLAPLNLNGYNLYWQCWQHDRHRYYLTCAILPKADVSAALTGDWKQLRVRAVGLVGWWSDNNIIFVLRSPVQTATTVALHHHQQRDWATRTLTATFKGIIAALRVEERFGIPYCVAFQDHSRGGLFGRVTAKIDWERLRRGVGLVLSRLDSGEVVVTATAGRKILGHLDPNTILNGDWGAVTRWVHSVIVDGILFGK